MAHDRDRIRQEIHELPIDPDPTEPILPHPIELVRRDADLLPAITLGGALGSLARWGLAQALPATGFAWSTFVTNVLGCALIGVLMALMVDRWSTTRYLRPLLGVGFQGTFPFPFSDAHFRSVAVRYAAPGEQASEISAGLCTAAGGGEEPPPPVDTVPDVPEPDVAGIVESDAGAASGFEARTGQPAADGALPETGAPPQGLLLALLGGIATLGGTWLVARSRRGQVPSA